MWWFSGALVALCALWAPALATGQETPAGEELQAEGEESEDDEEEVIVVTGSRTRKKLADVPVATEVITRKDIEESDADALEDVLEDHPGVEVVRNFSGTGLRMQGLDSEYILILIDGERAMGKRRGNVLDIGRLSVDNIEQIEIVKGSSSSLYGADAMAGVINIITREAREEFSAEARASAASFGTLDLTAGAAARTENYSLRLGGGWHKSDEIDLDKSDPISSLYSTDQWNVEASGRARLTSDWSLRARTEFQRRELTGASVGIGGAAFDITDLSENFTGSLTSETLFGDTSTLRVTGSHNIFRDQLLEDQRGSTAQDNYGETVEHLSQGSVQLDQVWFDDHFVSLGLDGQLERLESDRLDSGEGQRQRGAVFVQDEWTILRDPGLVLVPGARLDVDSQFGANPSPSVALRFDPTETLTLRSSIGAGYRAPSFRELFFLFDNSRNGYRVVGNEDLKPERSINFNLGAEYNPHKRVLFTVNLFWNQIDNLIFTETISEAMQAPLVFSYVNITSAYTRGVESSAQFKPWDGGTLDLGYTFTQTRDERLDRPLEGRPEHRATFQVAQRYQPWNLHGSLKGSWTGERTFYLDPRLPAGGSAGSVGGEDAEAMKADAYTLLDARIGWDPHKSITLFAGGENLLDEGDPVFLTIRPRSFYTGLQGRY